MIEQLVDNKSYVGENTKHSVENYENKADSITDDNSDSDDDLSASEDDFEEKGGNKDEERNTYGGKNRPWYIKGGLLRPKPINDENREDIKLFPEEASKEDRIVGMSDAITGYIKKN